MADGLRVLPDFNGNRSLLADPVARGVIEGLTLDASFHSLARLYYATATGIALGTRHIVQVLNAAGYEIDTLYLAGGYVANPVLLRDEADSVLAGTACVAAAAAGLHPALDASVRAATRAERRVRSRPEHRAHFDEAYSQFLRMQSRRG